MRLLALILLLAQEGLPDVPARMPVDEDPSAAACTFATALRGDACAYEAASAPPDPRCAGMRRAAAPGDLAHRPRGGLVARLLQLSGRVALLGRRLAVQARA